MRGIFYYMKSFGFIILALIWELSARNIDSPIFPPATVVLIVLGKMLFDIGTYRHISASIINILLGFAIASVFGFLTGILVAVSEKAALIISPLVDSVRAIAALTIFPLLILTFGLGIWSKVFVIFWTAWPPILLNTMKGITETDPEVKEAAALDGAGKAALLIKISIPWQSPTSSPV